MQFADDVQLPFEQLARGIVSAGDDRLTDDRFHVAGGLANDRVVQRHVAPSEKSLSFGGTDFFQSRFAKAAFAVVPRQKHIADAILARRWQRDSLLGQLGHKELVRHLQQNAGAVAGERIAAAGPAVRQIHQNFQPLPHDLVAFSTLHVDDKAHAAGIMLEGRIVQAFSAARIVLWFWRHNGN